MTLTPDMAALARLLALLESRYALRVVWALRTGQPQTFRMLQDSVGGITPSTLNTRLKELREARLVSHSDDGYRLTAEGTDLCRRLKDLPVFASRWAAVPVAAPATPRARSATQVAALRATAGPAARTAVAVPTRRRLGIIRGSEHLT